MIYIKEESFDKQISILHFLSKKEELDIIMWLFPESKIRSLCDINLAPKNLQEGDPVTIYDDDLQVKKTRRVKTTESLFIKMQNEKKTITENCDSLVLYRTQTKKWLACIIGHEYIVLVDDDSLLDTVTKQGFNASLEEPSWW